MNLQDQLKTLKIENLRLNNDVREKNRIIHRKMMKLKCLNLELKIMRTWKLYKKKKF